MIAFIDSGTTNSRIYLVENGKVIAESWRKVGVRDTALAGNNTILKEGIRDAVLDAINKVGCKIEQIQCFITSGMITSELGLLEIPHIVAPAGEIELALSVVEIHDTSIFPFDIPVIFIRGIKNEIYGQNNLIAELPKIDFMRGEEVQVFGILHKYRPKLPANIMIIGSHTKLIHVNKNRQITGSLTTISGQFYDALVQGTSIGKSVKIEESGIKRNFSDKEIFDVAKEVVSKSGLLRAMLMPRFMQVLMNTTSEERNLFINASIAVEDMKILEAAPELGFTVDSDYYLFGTKEMCHLYAQLLSEKFGRSLLVKQIFDKEELRDITVLGSLEVVKLAVEMKKARSIKDLEKIRSK